MTGTHIDDDDLGDYQLGQCAAPVRTVIAAHLRDCTACAAKAQLLEQSLGVLAKGRSDAGLQKLEAQLDGGKRFAHFGPLVAKLFDITADAARAVLESIDDEEGWISVRPDLHVLPVAAGPACTGAMVALVRLQPGAAFPHHKHTGHEEVMVLQGGYVDSFGAECWRGEVDVKEAGSEHAFAALPGVPCIVASVLFGESPFAEGAS